MDKAKIINSIKRPFTNPWSYFVTSLVFLLFTYYLFGIYSVAHWQIISPAYRIESSIERLINKKYEKALSEEYRNSLMPSCAEKGEFPNENEEETSKLSDSDRSELETYCMMLYDTDKVKKYGFKLLTLASYHLSALLALICSIVCVIVSLVRKKYLVAAMAAFIGFVSFNLMSIIM